MERMRRSLCSLVNKKVGRKCKRSIVRRVLPGPCLDLIERKNGAAMAIALCCASAASAMLMFLSQSLYTCCNATNRRIYIFYSILLSIAASHCRTVGCHGDAIDWKREEEEEDISQVRSTATNLIFVVQGARFFFLFFFSSSRTLIFYTQRAQRPSSDRRRKCCCCCCCCCCCVI